MRLDFTRRCFEHCALLRALLRCFFVMFFFVNFVYKKAATKLGRGLSSLIKSSVLRPALMLVQ